MTYLVGIVDDPLFERVALWVVGVHDDPRQGTEGDDDEHARGVDQHRTETGEENDRCHFNFLVMYATMIGHKTILVADEPTLSSRMPAGVQALVAETQREVLIQQYENIETISNIPAWQWDMCDMGL